MFVLEPDQLEGNNLVQVVVMYGASNTVEALGTFDAASIGTVEVRLFSRKRILIDFEEEEIVVEDLDDGSLILDGGRELVGLAVR